MVIAIPIEIDKNRSSLAAEHFGRSPLYYLVQDVKDASKDLVIKNGSDHFDGDLSPPEFLISKGIKQLIVVGMGKKAMDRFRDAGIALYKSAPATIEDIMNSYASNQLMPLNEHCKQSQEHISSENTTHQ